MDLNVYEFSFCCMEGTCLAKYWYSLALEPCKPIGLGALSSKMALQQDQWELEAICFRRQLSVIQRDWCV